MAKKPAKNPREKRQIKLARLPHRFSALSDLPLTTEQACHDCFGLVEQLGPVYDILRHPQTQPPLAMAIYGDWGTGKTTAMRWLHDLIKKGDEENEVKLTPVWFYPWKYHKMEDVWRGLIAEVIIKSIGIDNVTREKIVNAAKQFGLFLGRSFLNVLASLKLRAGIKAGAEAEAELDLAAIKEILADYRETTHPEDAFLNHFERLLTDWIESTIGEGRRMVIFIDDLDRCMPQVAFQVLEALKLYLNIDRLIFVVGIDRAVLESQIVKRYAEQGVDDEEKAKKYLDKMFQVEVTLTLRELQIASFLDEQLDAFPFWRDNLSAADRKIFRGVILNLAEGNPREVKRLVNSASMRGAGALMADELDNADRGD